MNGLKEIVAVEIYDIDEITLPGEVLESESDDDPDDEALGK